MYILFEEHQYDSQLVEKVLKDIYVLQDVDKKVSVQYVGYFYNPHLHDCVFILPKVLLRDENNVEVLSGIKREDNKSIRPEDILSPNDQKAILTKEYRKFIYEFSVWIYRALSVFYKANPESKAILYKHLPQSGKGKRNKANTYLDIVLSLIAFNQENRDYVLFTIKNLHRGNNKINWTKTISHSQAFVQDGTPIYLDPVNKKRIVNYEEELFVIFYSILNYLNEEYGFHTPINIQYELITGKQFKQYLHGMGKVRLMQIKYKYFSDKALQLWDLCYAFFENSYRIAIHTNTQEYILAKSFNVIFEAMIDDLIGERNVPKGLKEQEDGKRIDHIYTDLALTSAEEQSKREVYYIGDSKYYKNNHPVTSESIYKQYTYARNVVQWNINLFLNNTSHLDKTEEENREDDLKDFKNIHLQDADLTEGYDVIPNFFISAFVYDDRRYNDGAGNIRKHLVNDDKHCTKISYQFPDRLFDRDTLFLSQYDVNFLYVLFLYARNKANEKSQWKKDVRKKFREEIRTVIQEKFTIYAMRAKIGVNGADYLKKHFYDLNGRVFQPYGEDRKIYFAYARPNDGFEKTEGQYNELSDYFLIEKCSMGKDPEKVLKVKIEKELQKPIVSPKWLTLHYLERYPDNSVLVGYYKNKEHLQWILGNNDKNTLIYNVRLETRDNEKRSGAYKASFYEKQKVRFVILYTDDYKTSGEYMVFHVKDTASKVTAERMKQTLYPLEVKGDYFFYRFDEEVTLGKLRIKDLIHDLIDKKQVLGGGYIFGEPLFINAEELKEYRDGVGI